VSGRSRNDAPRSVTDVPPLSGPGVGLVFKAHKLLYHSTLGLRVIKKRKKRCGEELAFIAGSGFEVHRLRLRVIRVERFTVQEFYRAQGLVQGLGCKDCG